MFLLTLYSDGYEPAMNDEQVKEIYDEFVVKFVEEETESFTEYYPYNINLISAKVLHNPYGKEISAHVDYLIDKGLYVNSKEFRAAILDDKNFWNGGLASKYAVKKLIDYGFDPNNIIFEKNEKDARYNRPIPIIIEIGRGNIHIAKELIEKKMIAKSEEIFNKLLFTALWKKGNYEPNDLKSYIQVLLENGANPSSTRKDGKTLVQVAIDKGFDFSTIKLFEKTHPGSTTDYLAKILKQIEELEIKAESGNVQDQFELGKRYYSGVKGVNLDVEKATYWLKKAADNNHSEAQYYMAKLSNDTDDWLEWMTKSANQRDIFGTSTANRKSVTPMIE